jgi:hypothetical protein
MIERKQARRRIDPAQYEPAQIGPEPRPEMERSMGLASRALGAVVVIGAGAALIAAAAAAPRILHAARPALRQGLKRGLGAYAALRATAAQFTEDVEDLLAEVQSEISETNATVKSKDAADPPTERAEAS